MIQSINQSIFEIIQVDEMTTSTRVRFKSNLFGSLGAGLNVAPNIIDFGTVFLDFDKKLVENIHVVITVLGIILVYAIAAIICRKYDKIDMLKVSIKSKNII